MTAENEPETMQQIAVRNPMIYTEPVETGQDAYHFSPHGLQVVEEYAARGLLKGGVHTLFPVSRTTFYAMVDRQRDDFEMAWDRGRARHAEGLMQTINNASSHGDVKAAQWQLAALHGVTDKQPQTVVNVDQSDRRSFAIELSPPKSVDAQKKLAADRDRRVIEVDDRNISEVRPTPSTVSQKT